MTQMIVYVTFPDMAEARRIGRQLVFDRLVACVNILPGMESFYWWDGAVQDGHEVVMVAKTTVEKLDALQDCLVRMHSYDVPCLVAWPITHGHEPFLRWIDQETGISGR